MNILTIQISETPVGDDVIQTVNARDLHCALKVGRVFRSWIKSRIKEYGFEADIDYLTTEIGHQLPSGTKYSTEYFISIEMAKELAMVERTETGRAVRRYFIDCEKRQRQQDNNLMMQFNRAVLEVEQYTTLASDAGRALVLLGKQLKPQAKHKVDALMAKMQPSLFGDMPCLK